MRKKTSDMKTVTQTVNKGHKQKQRLEHPQRKGLYLVPRAKRRVAHRKFHS